MTAFRLRTHGDYEPEPGDLLESVATGNQWRILTAREVRRREPDPEFAHTWSLQVERVDRDEVPGSGCKLWPFERDREQRRRRSDR